MSKNIKFNKKSATEFFDSLSKIHDQSILEADLDTIDAITASEDRSFFLWARLNGDFGITDTFNMPSITKLSKAVAMVPDEEFSMKVASNNLEYKGKELKFKYHLYDNGILTKSKLSLAKIQSFTYDFEFEVEVSFIKNLLKCSTINKDVSKLYVYVEDGKLTWSIADRTMTNTDELTLVSEDVDFDMDPFIMKLENFRLISMLKVNKLKFRITKDRIGNIQLKSGDLELNYIIASLQK